jgi:hypothetical protein
MTLGGTKVAPIRRFKGKHGQTPVSPLPRIPFSLFPNPLQESA